MFNIGDKVKIVMDVLGQKEDSLVIGLEDIIEEVNIEKDTYKLKELNSWFCGIELEIL